MARSGPSSSNGDTKNTYSSKSVVRTQEQLVKGELIPELHPICQFPTNIASDVGAPQHSVERLLTSKTSYPPLVDHCKLQVRMNVKEKRVELRSSKFTTSTDALQMGADFVSAFAMGFDIDDAIALLRLDSLYIQSFDIKDVRQTLGAPLVDRWLGTLC